MAGKAQDYRIFVGGLSWDITERQLEDAFGRFGKVLECQACIEHKVMIEICCSADLSPHVMLERDTGRPRGFGFLTFADRRAMEDAIHDMHGREFGERVISVNKAQPKMGDEDSGGRGSYGGGDRSAGQGECFKCGRPGHWARDCPSAGSGRTFSPPRSKYGGAGGRGDHFANDRGQYMDDKYDRGRYGNRDRYDSKDDRYGSRDRYVNDRYPPTADRSAVEKYRGSDRYPQNGYGKDRSYDREGGPRGSSDRYGGGGPARYEGRNNRERPGPYDRPRRGGRPPSFDRY